MLVLFASSSVSYADYPSPLISAMVGEYNAYKAAEAEFNKLQDCQNLLGNLGLAYSAKQDAINKGIFVSIAAGVGAIGSVVLTGGATAPTVTGIIGTAAVLGMSWSGEDNLLERYNEAVLLTISQIESTKKAISAYNTAWSNYDKVWTDHTTNIPHSESDNHTPKVTESTWTPNY